MENKIYKLYIIELGNDPKVVHFNLMLFYGIDIYNPNQNVQIPLLYYETTDINKANEEKEKIENLGATVYLREEPMNDKEGSRDIISYDQDNKKLSVLLSFSSIEETQLLKERKIANTIVGIIYETLLKDNALFSHDAKGIVSHLIELIEEKSNQMIESLFLGEKEEEAFQYNYLDNIPNLEKLMNDFEGSKSLEIKFKKNLTCKTIDIYLSNGELYRFLYSLEEKHLKIISNIDLTEHIKYMFYILISFEKKLNIDTEEKKYSINDLFYLKNKLLLCLEGE